jgi:hypothetical protein
VVHFTKERKRKKALTAFKRKRKKYFRGDCQRVKGKKRKEEVLVVFK